MTHNITWKLASRTWTFEGRPLVMGILNVTPDSFSDGGRYFDTERAIARGEAMVADGADLLDIGGESSRPGAESVPLDEERRRVIPVVEALASKTSVLLSVDTIKPELAREAIEAGAHIVNDIRAVRDEAMLDVVRSTSCGVILMHMQGTPSTMQKAPKYADVVEEVLTFFQSRLSELQKEGIAENRLVLDPGIGFGKTLEHNLHLLRCLSNFQQLGCPVCLGVSRKSTLGKVLGREVHERLAGSLAAVAFALGQNAAQIVRVHDVAETRDLVEWYQTMMQP